MLVWLRWFSQEHHILQGFGRRCTKKKQKNVMLLWECKYPHKHEHISAFCLCLCTYDDSQKSTTFFWVCCTNTVQILTACGALVRIPVNTQARTFATLQKKPLLSIVTYEILTRAGPKNHPKKVPKKAFRRARISDCYIQLHFVKSTKFLFVVTTRDSGEAKQWMCTSQISA